jgi:hypothetical protein
MRLIITISRIFSLKLISRSAVQEFLIPLTERTEAARPKTKSTRI